MDVCRAGEGSSWEFVIKKLHSGLGVLKAALLYFFKTILVQEGGVCFGEFGLMTSAFLKPWPWP